MLCVTGKLLEHQAQYDAQNGKPAHNGKPAKGQVQASNTSHKHTPRQNSFYSDTLWCCCSTTIDASAEGEQIESERKIMK
jgi:hypothetical protein